MHKGSGLERLPGPFVRQLLDRQLPQLVIHQRQQLFGGVFIALLEFQAAVEEIFDVQLLPGLRFPEVLGFQKETLHHAFIIPHAGDSREDCPRQTAERFWCRQPTTRQ